MKKTFATLMVLFSTAMASATSLHPCTPNVPYQPSEMHCIDDQHLYSIDIQVLHSPRTPQCTGDNYYEFKKAKITIMDRQTQVPSATLEVFGDAFSYTLDPNGSKFQSQELKLNLENCVAPEQGGVSIGNIGF